MDVSMNEAIFQPGPPSDSSAVLYMYAVASRVVCNEPEVIDTVTSRLEQAVEGLVPPESLAAGDCQHLWALFSRVARQPKPTLRMEACRALYRDLDSIGQRLHLPPLPPWGELPEQLGERGGENDEVTVPEGVKRAHVVTELKRLYAELGPGQNVAAADVLRLLTELNIKELDELLGELRGSGRLSRSESSLVERFVLKKSTLGKDDEILIEVLERVGVWLVHSSS